VTDHLMFRELGGRPAAGQRGGIVSTQTMPALIIRCPRCPDYKQSTSVPLDKLKQLLEAREKITVMCNKCRYVFPLTDEEMKNLQAAVADGLFG
jgi:hypothetical protein